MRILLNHAHATIVKSILESCFCVASHHRMSSSRRVASDANFSYGLCVQSGWCFVAVGHIALQCKYVDILCNINLNNTLVIGLSKCNKFDCGYSRMAIFAAENAFRQFSTLPIIMTRCNSNILIDKNEQQSNVSSHGNFFKVKVSSK